MSYPFGQTVIWRQRSTATIDADGNDAYTYVPVSVAGAAFSPGPSIETVQGQDMVVDNSTLYLPAGMVPTAYDQFIVAGVTYDCVGSPNQWKSPFTGWEPGVVVSLKAVTG